MTSSINSSFSRAPPSTTKVDDGFIAFAEQHASYLHRTLLVQRETLLRELQLVHQTQLNRVALWERKLSESVHAWTGLCSDLLSDDANRMLTMQERYRQREDQVQNLFERLHAATLNAADQDKHRSMISLAAETESRLKLQCARIEVEKQQAALELEKQALAVQAERLQQGWRSLQAAAELLKQRSSVLDERETAIAAREKQFAEASQPLLPFSGDVTEVDESIESVMQPMSWVRDVDGLRRLLLLLGPSPPPRSHSSEDEDAQQSLILQLRPVDATRFSGCNVTLSITTLPDGSSPSQAVTSAIAVAAPVSDDGVIRFPISQDMFFLSSERKECHDSDKDALVGNGTMLGEAFITVLPPPVQHRQSVQPDRTPLKVFRIPFRCLLRPSSSLSSCVSLLPVSYSDTTEDSKKRVLRLRVVNAPPPQYVLKWGIHIKRSTTTTAATTNDETVALTDPSASSSTSSSSSPIGHIAVTPEDSSPSATTLSCSFPSDDSSHHWLQEGGAELFVMLTGFTSPLSFGKIPLPTDKTEKTINQVQLDAESHDSVTVPPVADASTAAASLGNSRSEEVSRVAAAAADSSCDPQQEVDVLVSKNGVESSSTTEPGEAASTRAEDVAPAVKLDAGDDGMKNHQRVYDVQIHRGTTVVQDLSTGRIEIRDSQHHKNESAALLPWRSKHPLSLWYPPDAHVACIVGLFCHSSNSTMDSGDEHVGRRGSSGNTKLVVYSIDEAAVEFEALMEELEEEDDDGVPQKEEKDGGSPGSSWWLFAPRHGESDCVLLCSAHRLVGLFLGATWSLRTLWDMKKEEYGQERNEVTCVDDDDGADGGNAVCVSFANGTKRRVVLGGDVSSSMFQTESVVPSATAVVEGGPLEGSAQNPVIETVPVQIDDPVTETIEPPVAASPEQQQQPSKKKKNKKNNKGR